MADDDELEDLEDELAELEDELAGIDEEPSDGTEAATGASSEEAGGGGLVDSVRDRLAGGEDDPSQDALSEEAAEEPPGDPDPAPAAAAGEPQEETPWDQEEGAWTAQGVRQGDEETVIVRRLDDEGNVVEERRGTRADLPREEAAAGGAPPPRDPEPADEPEDDEGGGRSWLVLLLIGLLLLAVVGAGVAYLALGGDDGGGLGGSEGPTASFTRTPTGTVATGTSVSFDASGSTIPDGADATYEWSFGDGGTAQGRNAVHSWSSPGTYEVELVVTADGQQASATKEVTVAEAPDAQIRVLVNGSRVNTDNPVLNGTEVTFSAAQSTAGGTITSYTWTIGGSTETGQQVTTSFPDPGHQRVTLTVETSQGFSDTDTVDVGVGYRASFSDTLPAAVTGPSEGPAHNFTVGGRTHGSLTPSLVQATLNYTTGTGGPLQDPTPAQLNVTDAADQTVASATGSEGLAEVRVTDFAGQVFGQWSARAAQDQGGAQKSYTLTVLVVYPTQR